VIQALHLTALFVGGTVRYQTQHHTSFMSEAFDEFRFLRSGKHFMEPSDYDEIPLCKIVYCTWPEVRDYWWNRWGRTIGQKMVAMHGSPCAPTPLTLILITNLKFPSSLVKPIS
jgi:hypothetical protein